MQKTSLSQLRFTDYLRPGDVVGWPQGPGEPLGLAETLVAQRAELDAPVLFFGLTQSETLRPGLAEHFGFRALNGAGTSAHPNHRESLSRALRDTQGAVT
jgi:hypothetical protein